MGRERCHARRKAFFVHVPINTERPLIALNNRLQETGSNAKSQSRRTVDDQPRRRNHIGYPGPRDRFPRIEHEVRTHLPHDRGDTLQNGLWVTVPLQGVDVPPVRLFQNPNDLFFG